MSQYEVDVVIPVHTSTRPIRRAVSSVLNTRRGRARALVVAHNIDPAHIRTGLADLVDHPDVRLLHLADGINSPAGPRNHGVEASTAEFFSVLDSDDELEEGALDSWLDTAGRTGADVVIARMLRTPQGPDPLPPTRPGRTSGLDAVRDRLAYRCSPQGLVRRSTFGHIRFSAGLVSGEDLEPTAQLWFTAQRIVYDRTGPAYLVHEDAVDRVTAAPRSVNDDFAFLDIVAASDWYPRLSRAQKRAWGVKNFRMHLMDAIAARVSERETLTASAPDIARIADRIEALSRGATALLARCDRVVLDEIRSASPDPQRIVAAFNRRWGRNPDALLPRNPFRAFNTQAPYRTMRNMVP